MSEAVAALHQAVIDRVLRGDGEATREQRAAAFANTPTVDLPASAHELIAKVATQAWTIEDGDVEAVKRAGVSEDAIFELAVCAAIGHSKRQLDAALAAVDAAFATVES